MTCHNAAFVSWHFGDKKRGTFLPNVELTESKSSKSASEMCLFLTFDKLTFLIYKLKNIKPI